MYSHPKKIANLRFEPQKVHSNLLLIILQMPVDYGKDVLFEPFLKIFYELVFECEAREAVSLSVSLPL